MRSGGSFDATLARRRAGRVLLGRVFMVLSLGAVSLGLIVLAVLLVDVVADGLPWLRLELFTQFPSRFVEKSGFRSALEGSLFMIALTALIAFPLGVGAAVYLEEYGGGGRLARLIEVNVANLAGVPSIIYGLLGLGLFVRGLGLGRSVLAGALTMTLLILPMVIVASREAIRAVPRSMRLAAYALGASQWEVIRDHVIPYSLPGILTGTILAVSRAIGETAPLITIGALTYIAFDLNGPMDLFTVLPIQIFNWISLPQQEFHELAAAGILVLLGVLFLFNLGAVLLRARLQRRW